MRLLILLTLLTLAACSRHLTENEAAFTRALHGDQTNLRPVRLHDRHFLGAITFQRPIRPRLTCGERIWPPSKGEAVTVSPGATVIFNRIFFRRDLYRADMMAEWPEIIDLADAMLFAHEMVHVWQWQNRDRTGYAPWRGLAEHTTSADPYLFDPDNTGDFLSYGFEQQASIVEEYLCCHLLDPDAPRTTRLRDMITKVMPVDGIEAAVAGSMVRIPWSGAQVEGICRAEGS